MYIMHEVLRLSFPENVNLRSFPLFICKNNEKISFPDFVFYVRKYMGSEMGLLFQGP